MADNNKVRSSIEDKLSKEEEKKNKGLRFYEDYLDDYAIPHGNDTTPVPYRPGYTPTPTLEDRVESPRSADPESEADKTATRYIAMVGDERARDELRRIYENEKERIGWAQAAETIGHALTQYGAARAGATGLQLPKSPWEAKYRDILEKYKVDLSDLSGREAETRREASRQEELAQRRELTEKELASRERIAGVRAEVDAAKEQKKEELRTRKEDLTRINQLRSQMNAMRRRKGSNITEDDIDLLLSDVDTNNLAGSEETSRLAEELEKMKEKYNDYIPFNEPSKVDVLAIYDKILTANENIIKSIGSGGTRTSTPRAQEDTEEEGEITVISPDGRKGTIPVSQLEQALREGYKRAK